MRELLNVGNSGLNLRKEFEGTLGLMNGTEASGGDRRDFSSLKNGSQTAVGCGLAVSVAQGGGQFTGSLGSFS